MELLGLDVGFSATRSSSGIARSNGAGDLSVAHTTSRWEDRQGIIGSGPVRVAAIDAPFTTAKPHESRNCERVFSFGAFQKRCKPGFSHIRGTGRRLRQAGWETAVQLASLAPVGDLQAEFPRVADSNVVEAFPNAFLGVYLDDRVFGRMPLLKRGGKFDWLYEAWVTTDRLRVLFSGLELAPYERLREALVANQHHDERAALVCLMTAACVYAGRYTAIGEAHGGYFFMPPLARAGLPGLATSWTYNGLGCQAFRSGATALRIV